MFGSGCCSNKSRNQRLFRLLGFIVKYLDTLYCLVCRHPYFPFDACSHPHILSLFPGSYLDVTRASEDESQDEDGSEDEDAAARRESGDERVATFPATPLGPFCVTQRLVVHQRGHGPGG